MNAAAVAITPTTATATMATWTSRAMTRPAPAGESIAPPFWHRGHGFVGHPALHVLAERQGRHITIGRPRRHGFEADGFQGSWNGRILAPGTWKLARLYGRQQHAKITALEWWLARKQTVQCCPQAINITGASKLREVSARLLRTHVSRRADRGASQRIDAADAARPQSPFIRRSFGIRATNDLGKSPINHQGFTVLPHHHVSGLEIAMKNSPAVRVVDRMAHIEKPARGAFATRDCARPDQVSGKRRRESVQSPP